MFLVIDGLDGAGKSTQWEALATWLRGQGHSVIACRDPGSTQLGNELRQVVLQRSSIPIDPRAEMMLFMAARTQLVSEVIRPALDQGQIVVCDRFQLSTLVYQGHAGGVPLSEIRAVGRFAAGELEPTHTFVLDLPPANALSRIERGLDRMESRGIEYFERVRKGFLLEASQLDEKCSIIDASQPSAEITRDICERVKQLLAVAQAKPGKNR
jgi:dTMP kinase